MNILIRGMKMPKNCKECKLKGEGSDSFYIWSCPFTGFEYTRYDCVNDRLNDCPLVEVNETLFSADNARKFLRENPPKGE